MANGCRFDYWYPLRLEEDGSQTSLIEQYRLPSEMPLTAAAHLQHSQFPSTPPCWAPSGSGLNEQEEGPACNGRDMSDKAQTCSGN